MSELLKKYESIDQSKLNEGAIKILNRVKTITSDFTTDDAKNNKIAEDVLNEIMKKYPDSVKIVKRTSKTKPAPKKVAKAKKPATTSTAKKSGNNIMSVAKEIQKAGESWNDAMERAKQVLKERREQVIQKQKTELEKLYALVKTKKELQGFAKSDIQRDAVRDAKPRGARVVTKEGSTSNQYGTFRNKLGRKYWETRDRHADRLAPNYPKDMPLLANGGELEKYKNQGWKKTNRSTQGFDVFSKKIDESIHYVVFDKKGNFLSRSKNNPEQAEMEAYQIVTKKGFANGGAINDAPFSVEVFKTKLRFDNELTSSSKGDLPTFAKAKEFAIDMIDNGNYYAYIISKNGYLWGVDSKGVEQFADGGSVSNERMYNFLQEDLAQLEEAIKSGDMEEVNKFFTYWLGSSGHLKSLETKTNERMYNFLKEDLEKLEVAVENNDTEEVERFFSYWGQHLESLKMAKGGAFWDRYKITPNKIIPNTSPKMVTSDYDNTIFIDGSKEEADQMAQYFVRENFETHPTATVTRLHKSGNPLKNKIVSYVTKDEISKYGNGGSLQYLTDPNFGNFQNTGAFADGGSIGDLTEQEFLKKYFGASVFTENPSQFFEIKKLSSSDDAKVSAFVKELKADGFTVKKRAFSDFTSVMGVKKKGSFELGGAFMTTDLAGHSGGGTGGLNANLPLNGFSGTNYTGLVGETGAMSSGELFMDGGAVAQNQQVIDGASQSYVNYYLANDGISQASYKDGGAIENQYEGRTPEDIWDNLTSQQKDHFLKDHIKNDYVNEYDRNNGVLKFTYARKYYNELPKEISEKFKEHVREGQYASGGVMEKNQQVIDDASQSYINYYLGEGASQGIYKDGGSLGEELMGGQSNSTLKPSGYHLVSAKGREIIVSDDGGNSKERWVKNNGVSGYRLVYKGNDYEFTDSFEGGGFTPDVSDGTQFMSGVYAKGGKIKVGGDDFTFLLELSDKELQKRLDLVNKQKSINAEQYFKAKEKKENTSKIEEAGTRLDNQWYAIVEARNRKNKNYAKGGKIKVGGDDFTFLLELSDKELQKRLDLVNKQKSINAEQYFKAKEKKENTSKIEEAGTRLDNQWYAIVEARNRKNKNYANGGSVDDSIIDELFNGYASAVLFTETDYDSGEPLDSEYSISDFDKETVTSTKKMLAEFYSKNKEAIEESELDLFTIGNDVWYTRSGQGAGFFDHSLDSEVEEKLTKGAKALGEYPSVETYDGKISIRGGRTFAKGGFTPDVSDGTQFMSEAYAYGGRTKSRPSMRELYIENIAFATNTRTAGVDAFAKEHNLTDSELSNLMTGIGRKMISQSDFITALVGNKNNPKQKEVVAFAKSDKAYKMADGGALKFKVGQGEKYFDKKEKMQLSIGKESDIPNVYNVTWEDGEHSIYSAENINFFISKGIWKKLDKMADGGALKFKVGQGEKYFDKKEKMQLSIGKESDIPNVYNVTWEDGEHSIYSAENINFFISKGIWKKLDKMADGGAINKDNVKVGDILVAKTGVKVKVVEFDPKFGGRVKVIRLDKYSTGKPSVFTPLSSFTHKVEVKKTKKELREEELESISEKVYEVWEKIGADSGGQIRADEKLLREYAEGTEKVMQKNNIKKGSFNQSDYDFYVDVNDHLLNDFLVFNGYYNDSVTKNETGWRIKNFEQEIKEKGKAVYVANPDVITVGLKTSSSSKPKKSVFIPTVEFNAGDIVWQKDEERYATIMNNYGDAINGDRGEIRLDTSGNTMIFTYDPKTYERTGYNLVKLGEKGDTGKFTPEVVAEMKESAKGLIDSRKERKDTEMIEYYEGIYKRLLDGEFDSMTKGTPKPKKYIDHDDIKSVTLKLKGKVVTIAGKDVLNGANLMEKGGDLSKIANYVPKRDVVEVELKDGSKVKPVNGYWVKKGSSYADGGFMNDVYANGGELKGSFLAEIKVPYNYGNVVKDEFEFTEFLSKVLTKKWFGNGVWGVSVVKPLFEKDYSQKIVVKIDIPVGVTQGGGLDKFDVLEFMSKTLTKKWFGNGIWGIDIVKKFAYGGGVGFKPYGKTKGNFKITYMEDGEKQSEIRETLEMAIDTANRYKKYDEFSKIEVFDESGKKIMADGGFMNDVYADGGGVSGYDNYQKLHADLKSRVVRAVGIDEAIKLYDSEYPIRPFQLLEKAVRSGFITLDEINQKVVDSAMEVAEDSEDMDEVGSSDMTYAMKDFLEEAGFQVDFVDGRLKRKFADGGMFEENDGFMKADNEFNYRYINREPKIDVLDEEIDLTSNFEPRRMVTDFSPENEEIDLSDDGRVRVIMTQSNRGSAENFGKINPRAFEFIDLPMPTSNKHKND